MYRDGSPGGCRGTGRPGDNVRVTKVAVVDRLRPGIRRLLRPTGALPRLSLRGQVFDIMVAVVLFIAAIEEGGGSGDVSWQIQDAERREGKVRAGPLGQGDAPYPPSVPVRPFLPIEHDQSGW